MHLVLGLREGRGSLPLPARASALALLPHKVRIERLIRCVIKRSICVIKRSICMAMYLLGCRPSRRAWLSSATRTRFRSGSTTSPRVNTLSDLLFAYKGLRINHLTLTLTLFIFSTCLGFREGRGSLPLPARASPLALLPHQVHRALRRSQARARKGPLRAGHRGMPC